MEGSVVLETSIKGIQVNFGDDEPVEAIQKLNKLQKAVEEGKCKDKEGNAV